MTVKKFVQSNPPAIVFCACMLVIATCATGYAIYIKANGVFFSNLLKNSWKSQLKSLSREICVVQGVEQNVNLTGYVTRNYLAAITSNSSNVNEIGGYVSTDFDKIYLKFNASNLQDFVCIEMTGPEKILPKLKYNPCLPPRFESALKIIEAPCNATTVKLDFEVMRTNDDLFDAFLSREEIERLVQGLLLCSSAIYLLVLIILCINIFC